MAESFPTLRAVVLDTTDARALAEFYRQLLGYDYRPIWFDHATGISDTQYELRPRFRESSRGFVFTTLVTF